MVYHHSVKVPTKYRRATSIFKKSITEKKSVKMLLNNQNNDTARNLLPIFRKYSDHKNIIEPIIEELNILVDNPRLDEYLCRVLITEILYGNANLIGQSKPVLTVLSYQDKIKTAFETINTSGQIVEKIKKPRYIRVNTNLYSIESALDYFKNTENFEQIEYDGSNYDAYLKVIREITQDQFVADIHIPGLFVFSSTLNSFWATHSLTAEKKLILQDRATCLVSLLLDPRPDSVVLDMCAAPGMKSIHISNIIGNSGKIYAIEQNMERYTTMVNIVKSANADKSIMTIHGDALATKADDYPGVEYILVDPSCSGSGMQKRLSLAKSNEEKDKQRLRQLSGLQIKLLTFAMTAFPDAKRIAYSTCSIYPEENEEVVQKCLERCSDFKLLNAKKSLRGIWKNTGSREYKGIGKYCLYSLPQDDLTDGIFIALFERIKIDE